LTQRRLFQLSKRARSDRTAAAIVVLIQRRSQKTTR